MSTGTEEAESIRTGSDPNTSDDAARSPETVFSPVGQKHMASKNRSSDTCITTTTKVGDRKSSDAAILTVTGGGRPEDFTYRGVDLLTACVSGDLPLVAMLLGEGIESGVDMLAADADGNTPLHYACLSDNPEVALFLLRKAACTSAGRGGGGGGDAGFSNGGRNSGGNSDSGGGGSQQPKRRQRFLLESRNSAFETPLLRAAVGGSVAVAQALMEAGADMFVSDSSQNTVFHNAARNGRLWVLAFFLAVDVTPPSDRPGGGGGGGGSGGGHGGGGGGSALDGTGRRGGGGGIVTPDAFAIGRRRRGSPHEGESNGAGGVGGSGGGGLHDGDSELSIVFDGVASAGSTTTNGNSIADSCGTKEAELRQLQQQEEQQQQWRRQQEGYGGLREHGGEDVAGVVVMCPAVSSLLRRTDCDGHTTLDWACYSGHTGVARLLIESGLDPSSTDREGKNCLHWAASQGQAETCRYLVLLGMDPLLPEASGVNAFQLAVRHPPATTSALSLSDAVKRQSSGGGGGRSVPAWQNGAGGSSGFGGSSNSSGGSGGGSSMWALRKRAPTAGSAVEGRGWNDAGKKTKRLHGVGNVVILPERLNPTRAWVVIALASPVCGVWALSFVLPWWGWLLVVVVFALAAKRLSAIADLCLAGAELGRRRGAQGSGGTRGSDTSRQGSETHSASLPVVAVLAVAPEKFVALWAGMAMSFIVYTAYVIVRLLTEDGGSSESEGAAGSGGGSGGDGGDEISWPFAGASIGGADGRTMTATGWVAALSVGCLAATLGLWSTLLAGNGRAAAVTVAATGAGAGAGAGGSTTEKQDKACMVAVGKKNKMNERRPGMGWGDPGAVIMSPKEDMKVLVEGVGAKVGPPEARKLCQTCLVRKPIRSKHCGECGLCVGRMDHHCVWLNNCVGCGNHRRFVAFVMCQLTYAILFSVVAGLSFSEELSSQDGAGDVLGTLLHKDYLPAFLLAVLSTIGTVTVAGIAFEQVRNMLANLTSNERINRNRYPWLNATPNGPRFNRYDRGAWGNLMEFWTIGTKVSAAEGDASDSGSRGRRRPRDYLKGYGLPSLDGKQQASLARVLQVHTVRRGLSKHGCSGDDDTSTCRDEGCSSEGGGESVQAVQRGKECAHVGREEEDCGRGEGRV